MARESFEDRYPESRGPGTETPGDGGVAYGGPPGAAAVVDPPRPAWERDRDMAAARERAAARCGRCASLPDDLVTAFTAALAEAHRAGREGRPL